jgi:hypothetical protein
MENPFGSYAAGLHRNVPEADYHSAQAISAGFVNDMTERSAAYAWHNSAMNPDYVPKRAAAMDFGTLVHLACLEPNRLAERIAVHDFPDYRSKDARAFRDAAYAAGKIPLKAEEFEPIAAIRRAILKDPIAGDLLKPGRGSVELTGFWFDPATGVPCKIRADHVLNAGRDIVDIKTTSNAHPENCRRRMAQAGHHIRAAWYLDAWERLTDGRRPQHYWFLTVERTAPYQVLVYECDSWALDVGQLIYRAALEKIARFASDGTIPGYVDPETQEPKRWQLGLPGYYERRFHERVENKEFRRDPAAILRLAAEMQAPLGIEDSI